MHEEPRARPRVTIGDAQVMIEPVAQDDGSIHISAGAFTVWLTGPEGEKRVSIARNQWSRRFGFSFPSTELDDLIGALERLANEAMRHGIGTRDPRR